MLKHLKVACTIIMFGSASLLHAQVTVGSTDAPSKGALLELKEQTGVGSTPSATKGVVFPRVALTNKDNLYPMFEPDGGNYKIGSTQYTKAVEDAKHAGMTVYNVTANATFAPGLHIWDGTSWLRMDNSPVIAPSITGLLCSGWTMQPATYTQNVPFEGVLKIPYTGGNGGAYAGTSSVAIGNGLNIELIAGKLAIGGGDVMYRVHGTPTVNSPIATPLTVTFLGQTCTSLQLGAAVEQKPMKYARKTVPYDVNVAANSEMTFGKLKVRIRWNPNTHPTFGAAGNTAYFEMSLVDGTPNTHTIIYEDIAGTGMAAGSAFALYAILVLKPLEWRNMVDNFGSGTVYQRATAGPLITVVNRDIVFYYIQFQHNDYNEIYRVTLNINKAIAASEGAAAVNANCTIFIEALE